MPPKPKKGGAAKKPKKETTPLDDIDTTTLTREKLEEFCVNVHEAFTKEMQHTEFLRLDRDNLTSMVDISRKQLTDLRISNRAKIVEKEDADDNHRIVMGQNRQKLINLTCDMNIEQVNKMLEIVGKIGHEMECHEDRMSKISSDIFDIKVKSNRLEHNVADQKTNLNIQHAKNRSKLKEKDKEVSMLMEGKNEKIVNNIVNKLQQRFLTECTDLEERKKKETAQYLKHQQRLITDLQHYYEDIVHRNLTVIMIMKTNCQEMKSNTALLTKQLTRLRTENIHLVSTLAGLQSEENRLQEKLAGSRRDQNELKSTQMEGQHRQAILDKMKWELETLKITSDRQNEEKDLKKRNKQSALLELTIHKEELLVILEHILTNLHLRIKEANYTLAVIRRIYLQQGKWNKILESVPCVDTTLDVLNYQLTSVIQERNRVTDLYKRLLEKHNLRLDDIGFLPQDSDDILKEARMLRVVVNRST